MERENQEPRLFRANLLVRSSKTVELPKVSKPSLEGYYHYVCSHFNDDQAQLLKFGLGRLSRRHPDIDPREALLEWFAETISEYERTLELRARGLF